MTFEELIDKAIEAFHKMFTEEELQKFAEEGIDSFGEFNEITNEVTPGDMGLFSIAKSDTMLMTVKPEALYTMEFESLIELTPLQMLYHVVVEAVEEELEQYWVSWRDEYLEGSDDDPGEYPDTGIGVLDFF